MHTRKAFYFRSDFLPTTYEEQIHSAAGRQNSWSFRRRLHQPAQALVCQVLGQDQHDIAFAVEHGDIEPNNIIIDENYNIKCVIDWGFATSVPISKAAGLPRFLWSSDTDPAKVAPSQSLLKDIRAYIACFSSQTLPMELSMLHLYNTEEVYFRALCLESTSSKQVHVSMARAGWKLPYSELLKDAEDHE
ncbi:hypothetical protein HDV62DRAFT_285008 [Trichoderma sp. SZMC 28011]